jgi:outer membrane protein TolC
VERLQIPLERPAASQATAPMLADSEVGRSAAAESAGEPSLDLEACVRIAIDRNPLVRAAREGVAAAAAGAGIARAPYYPEVGVTAGYRRFDTHLFLPAEVPLQESNLGATDDWSGAVAVGYTLYDHGQRQAERNAAWATQAASEEEAKRVHQDIVHAVHQAYYRVLSARAGISAAETALSRGRDHLALAKTRKEAGAAPRADVLRAQVEAADAELALVGARAALRVADGGLRSVMGLPVDMPVSIRDLDEAPAPPGDIDVAAALERALEQRPELDAARERIGAASSQAAAIKGIFGPRVGAEASLGWRDSEFLPEDQNWAAGVSFRLPLFSGFAKTHRLSRADAEKRALEAEFEALADRIELEVWTALSDLEASYDAVLRSDALRAIAEESLGFARARYEAGASAIADLLDAEGALSQADSAQVRAVLEFRLARAGLLRAQGDL